MSKKKLRLAPHACPAPVQPTDWHICALCQERGGILINPIATGSASPTTHLSSLCELNELPLNIDVSRLEDGDGIQETLRARNAKWHKACRVLCNAGQVERVRKRQCKARQELPQSPVKQHLRSASTPPTPKEIKHTHQPACFFCDETTGYFHKAETISLDNRVRHIATELRDTKLLAKLSVGDMIAIAAVYHIKCLASFYNKHRSQGIDTQLRCVPKLTHSHSAFAEVVSYIEEYGQSDGDLNHVFKLSDMKALYCECLQRLGGDTNGHIHSTRLAQKRQQCIPTLESHNSNSGTVLSYKEDVGDALLDACNSIQMMKLSC